MGAFDIANESRNEASCHGVFVRRCLGKLGTPHFQKCGHPKLWGRFWEGMNVHNIGYLTYYSFYPVNEARSPGQANSRPTDHATKTNQNSVFKEIFID